MSADYDKDPCIACNVEQAKTINSSFDGIHQLCPRCGEFKVSGSAQSLLGQALGKDKRAKISGWVLAQNRAGELPMITTANLESILARAIPSVIERATNLLQEAAKGLRNLSDGFNVNESRFLAATYSSNQSDVYYLMKLLKNKDLAAMEGMNGESKILPNGYVQLDELKKKVNMSSQGFVAMWFHEDLDKAYSNGFQVGILQAGYDPVRIDRVEHINKIDDEIIRQVKASKFIVADFTGHRGGVYFEAGFALGFDIPIFWTCHKKDLDELHFDIRQFNCIVWETPEELASKLEVRLEAVLGVGPNKISK